MNDWWKEGKIGYFNGTGGNEDTLFVSKQHRGWPQGPSEEANFREKA
jgi:hypothetical protein